MYGFSFRQLKIILIGFVLLLSLVACDNSQQGTMDEATKSNAGEGTQLIQRESGMEDVSETYCAILKPTVPEDTRYYYMIVDSFLVRIGKENQKMERLCFDSNCIHSRTERCAAYIPQFTELAVKDRQMLWLVGEELFFVSGVEKIPESEQYSNTIERYNLSTQERGEVMKLIALPNMGWSFLEKELYYFAGENGKYTLCSTHLATEETTVLAETKVAGEYLKVQNDKIYYIAQGKFYIFSMESRENILVDENVYDFVLKEDKVFYMKSRAGIYCYEDLTKMRECIYSKYPITYEDAALSYQNGALMVYFSDGDFLVLSESGEEKEKKKEWMYMQEFGELRQVEGGFLTGSVKNPAIYLIKYTEGVCESAITLQ